MAVRPFFTLHLTFQQRAAASKRSDKGGKKQKSKINYECFFDSCVDGSGAALLRVLAVATQHQHHFTQRFRGVFCGYKHRLGEKKTKTQYWASFTFGIDWEITVPVWKLPPAREISQWESTPPSTMANTTLNDGDSNAAKSVKIQAARALMNCWCVLQSRFINAFIWYSVQIGRHTRVETS